MTFGINIRNYAAGTWIEPEHCAGIRGGMLRKGRALWTPPGHNQLALKAFRAGSLQPNDTIPAYVTHDGNRIDGTLAVVDDAVHFTPAAKDAPEYPTLAQHREALKTAPLLADFLDFLFEETNIELPTGMNQERLLQKFYEIDGDALERERQALLEDLRRKQG